MNTRIGPLGKLDRSREPKYLHAVQMQLIPNRVRGRADTGCSSPVATYWHEISVKLHPVDKFCKEGLYAALIVSF